MTERLAVFLATSGHSGVDRIMGNLLPAIAREGIRVDLLKLEGHGPNLQDVPEGLRIVPLHRAHVGTSLPALVRYLRRERPDVLLSDKDRVNRTAIMARWLARVNTRLYVRIGTTVSANLANRRALERWKQIQSIRYLYPRADGILVPSRGAAEDLRRLMGVGCPGAQVVPSPVVREDLDALASAPLDDPWLNAADTPLLIAVGELSARKDHATLLRAFAGVRAQRAVRLAILGEGRERGNLQSLARELGISHELHLPGFVSNPYPWIKRAALLAHSSRWEGLAVVLVEALALGTPVVATDCPSGTRELLDGGRLGRLVTVGDADGLAREIIAALDATPDREALRVAAEPYQVARSARAYLRAMGFNDLD
jgi:glycosyltransferase involved in cell wall biosynthesis